MTTPGRRVAGGNVDGAAVADPCKCMNNHASVAPAHNGHCCFWPAGTDCRQAEFTAWVAEHKRHHPGWESSSAS